jgi:hypothetical protein
MTYVSIAPASAGFLFERNTVAATFAFVSEVLSFRIGRCKQANFAALEHEAVRAYRPPHLSEFRLELIGIFLFAFDLASLSLDVLSKLPFFLGKTVQMAQMAFRAFSEFLGTRYQITIADHPTPFDHAESARNRTAASAESAIMPGRGFFMREPPDRWVESGSLSAKPGKKFVRPSSEPTIQPMRRSPGMFPASAGAFSLRS